MTPEGRRRKARTILGRVLLARDTLEIAAEEFKALCDEIGIRPPALVSLIESFNNTRITTTQLETLLSGLKRAAKE